MKLEIGQVKDAEDRVGVAGLIGHDLGCPELGFLIEHNCQHMKTVAQRVGYGHGIQLGKAVGNQIVPGDAAFAPKIARVRASMDHADWHWEPQHIRRSDLTTTPSTGQRDPLCAATGSALAVVRVLARMIFCQLSRDRCRAGSSGRTSGSNPVWVVSAREQSADRRRYTLRYRHPPAATKSGGRTNWPPKLR